MRDDFELASKAFDLFSLQERRFALEEFARLRYPSIADRFFEAVHVVIREKARSVGAVARGSGDSTE